MIREEYNSDEDRETEDEMMAFIVLLKENSEVLSKSQLPEMKEKKKKIINLQVS